MNPSAREGKAGRRRRWRREKEAGKRTWEESPSHASKLARQPPLARGRNPPGPAGRPFPPLLKGGGPRQRWRDLARGRRKSGRLVAAPTGCNWGSAGARGGFHLIRPRFARPPFPPPFLSAMRTFPPPGESSLKGKACPGMAKAARWTKSLLQRPPLRANSVKKLL